VEGRRYWQGGLEAAFANVTQLFLDPTGFYGLYRYDV
jgi:hypothetical protein